MTILSKPLLDPIFDVEPVFEVRFDSKSRLEGVLVKTLRTFQATPVDDTRYSKLSSRLAYADFFTKPLKSKAFFGLRNKIMNIA